MFEKTRVCKALLVAFGGGLAIGAVPALAQTPAPDSQTQRVEITGSSIRRIDAETALPVQVLKREDIVRTGATSTVDLLQKLPSIQGSTGESSSVGGGSFGFSGVSIHNVGETRTLVLLNGHRLTQFGGQTLTGFAAAMDLNAIPISAIERVELLTDGASALYGADAIAGVVNFITKRDTTEGDVTLGYSKPEDGGAVEKRISVSKGFGRLSEDGFNVFFALAHDERTKLDANQREFGNTGRVFFSNNGKNYRFQQFSAAPIPANVLDDQGQLISPYQKVNGDCPAQTFRVIEPYNDGSGLVDDYCGFDFVSVLENFPERKRDSMMLSGDLRIGENHQLYLETLWSRTNQISRIAPVPGNIPIAAGSALHDQYLLPLGITQDTIAPYRIFDLGKRTNDDTAKFIDVALGAKGLIGSWDYDAFITHSESDVKGNISGYPGALAVRGLIQSGLLNPFVGPGEQTAEAQAALDAVNYKGYWDGGTAKLDTFQVKASGDLFAMPAGPAKIGVGANYQMEKFTSKPSPFAQGILSDPVAGTPCDPVNNPDGCDQRFGDASAVPPYSADRKAWGLFAEVVIPAAKSLELTAAVRYDHYSDFGNATTAKGSFRWSPSRQFLLRGSVGTGFHAPTVPQVNAAQQSFGVTSDNYTCSPELQQVATSLGAQCQIGNRQYDQLAGGNPNLKPEKSRQATLGVVLEPTPGVSLAADLWHVAIRDVFGQLTEQEVFANPLQYPNSWATARDIATGVTYLAFLANNQNLGKSYATGVDLNFQGRAKTGAGDVNSQFTMTYMVREDQQLTVGGPYFSAIGNNAELGAVTFRWQGRWTNSLKAGNWTHTLGLNFKSGYKDQVTTVDVLDDAGNVTGQEDIRLDVKEHFTFDWQTQWAPMPSLLLTAGILNLLDEDPPFSLSTAGVNKGQQFGYDDRYYDPRGRTYYVSASYKF